MEGYAALLFTKSRTVKLIEVADQICILRKKWTPLAERRVRSDAEDLLTQAAEYTLKRAKRLTSPGHVANCYVQILHNYIKNLLKARAVRHGYVNSQLVIAAGSVEWGYSSRYELRQALNIALGSLPDDIRIDVWRMYVVEDSITEISRSRGIQRSWCQARIAGALKELAIHPALAPWKPKR